MSVQDSDLSAVERLRREIVARRLAGSAATPVGASGIPRADRAAMLPVSFAQERLWLLEKLSEQSDGYVLAFARRVHGGLERAAWQGALDDVVARHEVLRTALAEVDGRPVQRVAENVSVPLDWHDLSGRGIEAAREQAREFARQRFDLEAAPLLRAGVWVLGPADCVAVVAVHHAVCDGWSGRILLDELSEFYQGRLAGASVLLPVLPVQYADFAAWQRDRVSGGLLERQLGYWRDALAGVPVLELPADRARPVAQSGRGGVVELPLSAELVAGLEDLGRDRGATLFMVLLAAFQVVLARWSGQQDVAVGTPVAGRGRVEVESLIGLFVNTLVVRGDLSREPSFAQYLDRVREAVLGAFDHQDVPFERLVEELRPERDLSRNPLFQAWLVLQNYAPAAEAGGSDYLEYLELDEGAAFAPFDISLMAYPVAEGMVCRFTYAADLFDEASIARLAGHVGRVLAAVVTDPGAGVWELDLLSPEDRAELLTLAGSADPQVETFAVAGEAGAVALVCGEQELTYAELDGLVGGLAVELGERGATAGSAVGVCVGRGVWSVAAMLAVWRIGGVYVPFDPAFPAERLRYMVGEAGVGWVIADPGTAGVVAALGVRTVPVAEVRPLENIPAVGVAEDDLAYVIFTSGSSGKPKAVGVEHGALNRHVAAARELFGVTARDRVLAFSSFTFDASLDQLLPALAAGAAIVIRPDAQWLPSRIPALVARHGITVANFPPTFWAELAAALTERNAADLAPLRLLILGGEAIPAGALAQWQALVPQVRVLNAYGPTETTVTATAHEVSATTDTGRVPIGRPLGGRRVYVVDGRDELAPVGVPGELLIGGPELARGYLGRPELTAERFVPSAHGRLYRTGDLVRWLPSGELEFLGRVDDQVKIRGFRIELGEVEAVLAQCPGVLAAAAAVRPDAQGGQTLVGYTVSEVDSATLRAWCAQHLPHYLVPTAFVALAHLPANASGKLDRAALPAPQADRGSGTEFVAPRDETERMIAEIWGEVLRVERVGIDDGFFDLGGHSLLATMAVSRIAERLGREVELRTLFENPRIREFGPLVSAARESVTTGVVAVDRSGPLPMSFAQERLWFLDRMSELGDDYVLWFSWRVTGPVDRAAWQGALDDVVARHEVLRTALVEVNGRPVQRVLAEVGVPLEWQDVPGIERARELAAEFATRRFDLARPPMVHAGVWRLGPADSVAVIAFHHVATDGWSKRIFMAEFAEFYRGRLAGVPAVLPALPVQYGDFAVWQRGWMAGDVLAAQLDYWRDPLSGVSPLELPTDRARPAVRSGRGGAVTVPLAPELVPGLEELARGNGATLFMVLLAAFQVVLARWSGQQDVTVGTPVAGRSRVELEGLIGFFVNTLVLRGDLTGQPSFVDYLGRVREAVLGAFDHQDVPFERLVEELRPERDLGRNPLFQVMFDVQEGSASRPAATGLDFEGLDLPWDSAKFDLTSTFSLQDNRFALEVEYSSDLFDEASVRRLAEHVGRVLTAVVADSGTGVWDVDLLSAGERAELLALAGTDAPAPPPVAVRGTGTALLCGNETISYPELERLTAGLAATLAERGVRRGDAVGVCLGRGVWSVIAMLAVWRAGAVYVPLDPQFPLGRLEFMVSEAAVGWVVADAGTAETVAALDVAPVPVADVRPAETGPVAVAAAGDLAYVIFTSGSSGRPKAVGVPHGALARHIAAARELFAVNAEDTVLTFASFSFDASLEQVLPALTVGARLVVRPDEVWAVEELAAEVRARGVTLLELTPAYWEEVVARLDDVAHDLHSLRLLVTGGEVLPSAPLSTWFARLPGVPVVNTYGPTESVISTTAHRIDGPVTGRVPIGRPLGGRRVYVVDARDELVPVGVPGELLVGGPELARGYLGRPGLTAERFVPGPRGRLYRTGDLVRWLPSGDLEFLGRVDDQVKIRGFRIELGEIEAVLAGFDGVRGVVVRVCEPRGEKMLAAYVAGDGLDPAALAQWCQRFLPDYMVPAVFVPLDALPLTVQGKVDLAALPAPEPPEPVEFVAPRSPTEMVTAQIWAEVLGAEKVGLRDNFFALGGHSLRAVAVASRLRAAFDCPIGVRDLFENPTVEQLSDEVERQLIEQIAAMSEDEIDLSLSIDY